jgi:hypothetical protein
MRSVDGEDVWERLRRVHGELRATIAACDAADDDPPRPKLTLAKRPVWLAELETLADGLAEQYLSPTIVTRNDSAKLTLLQGGDPA